ncbi:MAG: hypothetical protein QF561_05180 [Phycisphaerales bacterium]|jgi:hypothetical protein|nr:hypothetical protein [Phycisphaerales bacterium]
MPTSGLVLTLSAGTTPASISSQAATLQADQKETAAAINAIERMAGIEQVAITWIGLDEPESAPPATAPVANTKECQP